MTCPPPTVTSADRTTIAYELQGNGPALVLIDGATQTRAVGSKPELVNRIAGRLTPAGAVDEGVVTILKDNLKLLHRFTELFRIPPQRGPAEVVS